MNTINVTVELCKEDRQRLDEVIGFLGLIACELKSHPGVHLPADFIVPGALTATAPQSTEKPEPVETEHPVEEVTAPAEPEPVAEPEQPKVTLDDIQALVLKLAAPNSGKRAEVRAIVKEYAERVSLIPADKFAEVMDKLTALSKEG
jgi:hypothetical protein